MARTGFGSRFLLGPRSAGLLGQVLVTFFVLSIGLALCAGASVLGLLGVHEVLDPTATMYRLRPVPGDPPLRGPRRFSATLQAQGDALPPVCAVIHEHYVSGKNGGWRLDGTWARSVGAVIAPWTRSAGTVIAPALWVRENEPVIFDPFDPLLVTGERDEWFRTVLGSVPAGGRLRAHCVANGEAVFLEGCVDSGSAFLTGCGATPLTITTGDGTAQPRIDAHASTVAGQLAAGAAGLVAVMAYLWYLLRARPLADALLRRAGPVSATALWPQAAAIVTGATLGAIAQGMMVWTAADGTAASRSRPGYLAGLLVCAVAGVLALVVRRRRQVLDRAMKPVQEAETVPLCDARGGVVEIAVNVRNDAPCVAGILDAQPHAWVEIRVEETNNVGKRNVTRLAARKFWPAKVAVRDASGVGLLDLTHAELDLRSTVANFKDGSAGRLATALAQSAIGTLRPGPGHVRWTVEQSVLDPGETLYVLGQCTRVEDPRAASSYRADSTMAVVGGAPNARIIVHAGNERSLLHSIGLERTYLDLLTAALGGVTASVLVTMLALWAA